MLAPGLACGLGVSPDGKRLAPGGRDHTVKLRDVARGQLLSTLSQADEVIVVAFSPDGTQLVSGGQDSQLCLVGRVA